MAAVTKTSTFSQTQESWCSQPAIRRWEKNSYLKHSVPFQQKDAEKSKNLVILRLIYHHYSSLELTTNVVMSKWHQSGQWDTQWNCIWSTQKSRASDRECSR